MAEDTMYDEPLGYRNYYPCFKTSEQHFKEDCEGLDVRQSGLQGEYLVSDPNNPYNKKGYLYLLNGGSTRPIKYETFPIPCPKVRKGIETKWLQGRWAKLLKSGWVSA